MRAETVQNFDNRSHYYAIAGIARISGSCKNLAISHPTIRAEAGQNFVFVSLQRRGTAGLEGHPFVLHLVPELFDAVQFRAVGWQEIKREALLLQEGQEGLDFLRLVDGSIVQNYRQGSADAFQEETKESAKKKRRSLSPGTWP